MFDLLQTSLESISDFMDRGGSVLWLIALLLFFYLHLLQGTRLKRQIFYVFAYHF